MRYELYTYFPLTVCRARTRHLPVYGTDVDREYFENVSMFDTFADADLRSTQCPDW